MHKREFFGVTYKGETKAELYMDLYNRGGCSLQDIADYESVSRAAIHNTIQRWINESEDSKIYEKRFAHWESVKTRFEFELAIHRMIKENKSLEEIQACFPCSLTRVKTTYKRLLGPQKKQALKLHQRQQNFILSVFKEYPKVKFLTVGENFEQMNQALDIILENENEVALLRAYYFDNQLNDRMKRGVALRKFGEKLTQKVTIKELIDTGVLIEN